MKRVLTLVALISIKSAISQTLFVPGGNVGSSTNGNVGIGTSSPAVALTFPSGSTGIGWSFSSTNNSVYHSITKPNTTPSPLTFKVAYSAWPSDAPLYEFQGQGGNVVMEMLNNGNVGIGTTNPLVKLKVTGDIESNNMMRATGWLNGTGSGQAAEIGVSSGNSYLVSYNRSTSTYTNLRIAGSTINLGHNDTSADLFINSNGNVGIGTTNPMFKMDLYGSNENVFRLLNSASGQDNDRLNFLIKDNQVTFQTDGSITAPNILFKLFNYNAFCISSSGIGVGTTNPGAPLHVFSQSGDIAYFQSGIGTTNFKITQETLSGRVGMKIGTVGASEDLRFTAGSTDSKMVLLHTTGNVGIGITNPQYKLTVEGTIAAREVKVTTEAWADFVFKSTYKLRPLGEVEQFIKDNNHLPEIPTEKEVKENGVSLGEMNAKLLQKVEELTLYVIELQKQVDQLKTQKGK